MANEPIQALIQTADQLNILIESEGGFMTGYDITLRQTANQYPSPAGRTITSTTRTENDVVNISGWIRSVLCNGREIDTSGYLVSLKERIEAQKYTIEDFDTILTGDGIFENMRLTQATWRRNGELPQEILVSMSWEQLNIAGSITNPMLDIGGLQG